MENTCKDCLEYDLNEKYGMKYYCNWYKSYYHTDESACRHFAPRNNNQSGGCYITTIVHDILKKDDNCDVLNTLRNFRDNVLQKDEQYKDILIQYDIVGPLIAENIALDNDKTFCDVLYNKSLKPISKMIKNKKYLDAIENYKQLTNNLQECYGINELNINVNSFDEEYDQSRGGHGISYLKSKDKM